MHSGRKLILAAAVLVMPLLCGIGVFAAAPLNIPGNDPANVVADDYVPDVKDRVARISFLRGDVSVKRRGSDEWERAVLNLPLVAGDEIAADANGRCEIQFNTYTHLRISENSILRLTALQDEGIAVSLPQGTLSLRAMNFDKDRAYFEIDAPGTTVAIQRSGIYRVDAGQSSDADVRVSVFQDGEARVYSDNSGFTLRSGRSSTLSVSGTYAGEWQTSDADRYADEFDAWALERDAVIDKRMRDAYYDRYYDRDIYGAEDLNEFGEWIHTSKYGYVWRPHSSTTTQYANWSPYRYGHWRWVPPYGWTWIADEPWGWATYHHGRWVWDGSYWMWSPYGYYRYRRSWWEPSLVVFTTVSTNICWYPLPYHRRNRNYNSHHGPRHNNQNQGGSSPNTPPANPAPSPTPAAPGEYPVLTAEQRRRRVTTPPLQNIPPNAVVAVDAKEFGRGRGRFHTVPAAAARAAITKSASDTGETPPILPPPGRSDTRTRLEIGADKPTIAMKAETGRRIGAADRTTPAALDTELRNKRVFGDRQPLPATEQAPKVGAGEAREPRRTGAVQRPVIVKEDRSREPADTPPVYSPRVRDRDRPKSDVPAAPHSPPDVPPVQRQPKSDPPPARRYDPPKDDSPRYDPPPRDEPKPRNDPPKQDTPKSDPPPQKTDGAVNRRVKDG